VHPITKPDPRVGHKALVAKERSQEGSAMGTTTSIEREKALAWIARQLRWERTLNDLRHGEAVERQAA
jgi:hypothetical protein